jgi:hypothetical protein
VADSVLQDDDLYLDASTSKELGEIKLDIWKIIEKGGRPRTFQQFPEGQKVHERSKKSTSHRVK